MTLDNGADLPYGSSGSWVIDKDSCEIHGHAVADDAFGDIFVVPIRDIFADIDKVKGVKAVTLPSDIDVVSHRYLPKTPMELVPRVSSNAAFGDQEGRVEVGSTMELSSRQTPPKINDEEGVLDIEPIAEIDSDETMVGTPTKATRWLFETPDVIRKFVYKTYSREHYNTLAERAKSLVKANLKHLRGENGEEVQAKVACRAKKKDSLEEKLKMRELENRRPYKDHDDIERGVKDLARAQQDSVKRIIRDIWGPGVEKNHHGSESSTKAEQVDAQKKKGYVRKHFGYQAMNYRTPMKKEHEVEEAYEYKESDWVEIQVVSALGHAWAEAGHDVQYKSHAFGPPTEREERILDALSGLVSTGDLLLEEFRGLPKDEYAEDGEEDVETLDMGYRGDFSPATADIVLLISTSL
ncbi:hypothetical protein DM02DRAFT_685698 [Periconia macrospinosa]|uniref:RelA/SpoT domain-containing protein n=1 Tax=Periconia macrospinosa TaxID=97972 RepID=A0A2V1DGR8_9PLEO|nr:hypothetical protein DM02DRAFT_685698 [Periconia macrospinosa]